MTGHHAWGARGWPPAWLLGLHRHSLANLFVLGGTSTRRLEVVRAFHDTSPVRAGPIVRLDCALHERRLRAALQEWVTADDGGSGSQLLRQSAGGTLFLDGLGRLARETQELLALFARQPLGESPGAPLEPRACRLAAGSARGLITRVIEGSYSGALLDCLDKIRVQLPQPGRRRAA